MTDWQLEVKRPGGDWHVYWTGEPLELVLRDALELRDNPQHGVEAVRMTSARP